MNKRSNISMLAAVTAAALLTALLPADGGARASAGARDVIVRFEPSLPGADRKAAVRAAGGRVTHDLHLIDGLGARMSAPAARRLSGAPGVRSVAFAVPVAGSYARRATSQVYGATVGAQRLWQGGDTGRGVGVAVIDTGIAADLPDFRLSRSNQRSRVRATAVVNPAAKNAQDRYGHGTHVAGIIAGDGRNRRGGDRFVGVAPGAKLISVKIDDGEGNATTLDAIYGIQFAVDHAEELGIRVVNLSLASASPESPATDPLAAAAEAAWLQGLVVVAAAGNEGTAENAVAHAPGNDPYVLTVGATDDRGTASPQDDVLATWSSRGITQTGVAKPEVTAPGSAIVSTLAPGSAYAKLCRECVVDRDYFRAGGTSMATAVVSGAVALLLERHPEWTPDQVKAALVGSAGEVGQIRADRAARLAPASTSQAHPTNVLVDAATGAIDYTAASWRAASWRMTASGSGWSAASWRCDCGLDAEGKVDPAAASWRAASWRTSFTK